MKSFSFALPGSIYEVSPDFGMFSQAWNMYAFGEPIIKQFFGIKPFAHLKTIHVSPLLPSKIAEGKIEKVEIGNNTIDMSFTQKTESDSFEFEQKIADFIQKRDSQSFDITQKQDNWKLVFSQPKGKFSVWKLNGKVVKPKAIGDTEVVECKGLKNSLVLIK
jgi:hypothetical protein